MDGGDTEGGYNQPVQTDGERRNNHETQFCYPHHSLNLTGLLNLTFVSFAQQQIPKGGKWLKKAEMPTIRSDLAAVAVGGKIYAMGGRNSAEGLDRLATVEEYNPVTDTWKKVADMPTARTRFVAAAVNGKIYALGGVTTVKRRDGKLIAKSVKPVDEYDPATNTWATKGEIPAASNVAASVLDGKIYVMALGLVDNGVIIYDPATDTSAEGPKLIEGRWALMSGAANGKVYVFGGFRKENHIVETVEEYDPAQNTWVKKQDWAKPKYLCGPSVATVNGQIYVISGSTGADDGWALRKTVEAYDPAKDAWDQAKEYTNCETRFSHRCFEGEDLRHWGRRQKSGGLSQRASVQRLARGETKRARRRIYARRLAVRCLPAGQARHNLGDNQSHGLKVYPSPLLYLPPKSRCYLFRESKHYSTVDPRCRNARNERTTSGLGGAEGGYNQPSRRAVKGETTMKRNFVILSITLILTGLLGFSSISLAQGGQWKKKADMPTARADLAASAVNGMIYAFGGRDGNDRLTTVEIYNPATDTWKKGADMPAPRSQFATAVVGGKIYLFGGFSWVERRGKKIEKTIAVVDVYDPAADAWEQKGKAITARTRMGVAVLNGKVYITGGFRNTGGGADHLEIYDPATDTWQNGAKLIEARWLLTSAAVNGKVYVIGGFIKDNRLLEVVEEYDPATNKWSKKADLPNPRQELSHSSPVVDGKIYVMGGNDIGQTFHSVDIYDPPPTHGRREKGCQRQKTP